MKFLQIEIEHVLAYDKLARIDLSGTGEDRNIVLIWGRNGMGKTSFLNSLRLLFTGVEHPSSRIVGFPPRPLPPRQYVTGDGKGWSGLINQRARRRSEHGGRPTVARVQAVWEADGRKVTAERKWHYDGTAFTESLSVFDGENRLADEVAEARLEDFLPKDFVGFFFFDGEDIKSLAENAERKQIDFDKLLRITFLKEAAEELKKHIRVRQRSVFEKDQFGELVEVEVQLTRARNAASAARSELMEIDDELVNNKVELRRLATRRENLSSGASEAQREALETRRLKLKDEFASISEEISVGLPPDVPMLANLDLVHRALEAVEARLAAAGAAEVVLVRRVQTELPKWIEEGPVKLDAAEVTILSDAISERIGNLVDDSKGTGLFSRLELGRADRLRSSLLRWATVGPDIRGIQVASLNEAERIRFELQQVNDALMEIEVGSQANLESYKKTVAEIAKLEEKIAECNQRKGALEDKLTELTKEEKQLTEQQERLHKLRDEASEEHRDLRFYGAVLRTLNEVTESLRHEMRRRIEALINRRFPLLISDHPLIERITLDESYQQFPVEWPDRWNVKQISRLGGAPVRGFS